jgi:hypothetical protein
MLFLAFASDLKETIFMWGRVHAKKVKPDKTPSQDMRVAWDTILTY